MIKTKQGLVNRVRIQMNKQKWVRAYNQTVGCRYQIVQDDSSTIGCAIGCLIPKEKYDPNMEGIQVTYSATSLTYFPESSQDKVKRILKAANLDISLLPELNQLQRAHDNCKNINWKPEFDALVKQWGCK